jgi:hypothetical protein
VLCAPRLDHAGFIRFFWGGWEGNIFHRGLIFLLRRESDAADRENEMDRIGTVF